MNQIKLLQKKYIEAIEKHRVAFENYNSEIDEEYAKKGIDIETGNVEELIKIDQKIGTKYNLSQLSLNKIQSQYEYYIHGIKLLIELSKRYNKDPKSFIDLLDMITTKKYIICTKSKEIERILSKIIAHKELNLSIPLQTI